MYLDSVLPVQRTMKQSSFYQSKRHGNICVVVIHMRNLFVNIAGVHKQYANPRANT